MIMTKENDQLKALLVLAIIISTLLGTIFIFAPSGRGYSYELKTFQSYDELLEFLQARYENFSGYGWNGRGDIMIEFADGVKASSAESNDYAGASIDYSETYIL